MSVNASFAPPGEDSHALALEYASLVETYLEAIAYGVALLLFGRTSFLLFTKRTPLSALARCGFFLFILSQLTLVTLGIAGNFQLTVLGFVYNRNIEGGPISFEGQYSNLPVSFMSVVGFVGGVWGQDGFLLYRFWTIWNDTSKSTSRKLITVLLFALSLSVYFVIIAFSLILLSLLGASGTSLRVPATIPVSLVFFSSSVSLNALLSLLIIFRTRSKDIVNMTIESASLYTVTGFVWIGVFVRSDVGSSVVSGVYGVMTSIAPTLIVLRIAQGRAWRPSNGQVVDAHDVHDDRRSDSRGSDINEKGSLRV